MEPSAEPEGVTAKQTEDRRFASSVGGLWARMLLFAAGIYASDLATRSGIVAILALDVAVLVALALAWRTSRLTFGTIGIAISVGVFQLAVLARGDAEPFANGFLLALSFILFLMSLFVGNRRPRQPSAS